MGQLVKKMSLILCYDEHDDRITASACYSYSDLDSLNDRIVIPRNIYANMTEGIFNLYVNKLKEKIKLNRMKKDF